ncbi:hypothetical protein NQ317_001401 [Molorchus minor]|uniref:Aminopeptidase N n=1 Tax=Molorchus minor TaxID=1323400 RepID=A0ABQ9J772_9CUCU|nr:hypothetical protein NQ317_001401 [Molorchus minor]
MPFVPILILAVTISSTYTSTAALEPNAENYRLPSWYNPSAYEIELTLPPESFTSISDQFSGTVVVSFTVTAVVNNISLHVTEEFITIGTIRVNSIIRDNSTGALTTSSLVITGYSINNTTDILTINLGSNLDVGVTHLLIIQYTGRLSTSDMYGIYKSSYVDRIGVTKYLVATQFQATHARRAFPCFDEPGFKATFDVTIDIPSGLNALFNTGQTRSTTNVTSGITTVTFKTTPKMSTYLVALIVSEFTCTTGLSIGTVPYQVCSRNASAGTRQLAVTYGPSLLAALNNFTNYDYSRGNEKIDLVAIPGFAAGAMENWGLITYREKALLWDPNESSNRYKQKVATMVAHELSQQWFGNLVTMKWWSEPFLKDGFARYFEYYITHEVTPTWELDKQFVIEQVHSTLVSDALATAQALQMDCSTPSEISSRFGTITYGKGASVLRMVEHFMQSENFRAGLQNYLLTYEYNNTLPKDLWTTLNANINNSLSKLPASLETVMYTWVHNPGFPLLTVTQRGNTVTISQRRFLLSGADTITEWFVPISYTTSMSRNKFETTTPDVWLVPDEDVEITLPPNAKWIILNNQQTGYYRVNYDDGLWERIRGALLRSNFDGIPQLNRAQIVDDLFNLARSGHVRYTKIFRVLRFLYNDDSYYTWYPALAGYNFLLRRVGEDSSLGVMIGWSVLEIMTRFYISAPITELKEDDQIYTFKQILAHTWACRLRAPNCIEEVRGQFSEYKLSGIRPNRNLRGIVYCYGLRYSNDTTDWDFLWNAYTTSSNLETEQITILSALGCTRNRALLKGYLLKSITNNSGIRPQDADSVFSSVYSGSTIGAEVAFDFLMENHVAIAEKYQGWDSLGNLVRGVAERFTTQVQVDRLRNFTQTNNLPDTFRIVANEALEAAEANLKWLAQHEEELTAYFSGAEKLCSSVLALALAVALIGTQCYLTKKNVILDKRPLIQVNMYSSIYRSTSLIILSSLLCLSIQDPLDYRLPDIYTPQHYEVHLNLPTTIFTGTTAEYNGTVTINFTVTVDTNEVKLHSSYDDIKISKVVISGNEANESEYCVALASDILTISSTDGFVAGEYYDLFIDFSGKLRTDMDGFYKRSYEDDSGTKKYFVTTNFQPISARKAFPCFDEPAFKAMFDIYVTYPKEYNAIGNSPGEVYDTDSQSETFKFETTPKMSTYSLALLISDFTCTGSEVEGVDLRVCSRDNLSAKRSWAAETGPKILQALTDFTGIGYIDAMTKLDQTAVPDYPQDAVGSWGLPMYNERHVLWDADENSIAEKQDIAITIAKQFCHQWFGDLVTTKWWSEAFLNDGFATYCAYHVLQEVFPDYQLAQQFVVNVMQPVMVTDSYEYNEEQQALQSESPTPYEVVRKFGTISKNKGSSILYMLEHIMTSEDFITGIKDYINLNQFSNVVPDDLWNTLNERVDNSASKLPRELSEIMKNWTVETGFPLVEVTLNGTQVTVTQERFVLNLEDRDTTTKWYVPISFTTSNDQNMFSQTSPVAWLTPDSDLTINFPETPSWIILNNQMTGYYRVNYDDALWSSIGQALASENFDGIPELNRAQIVDDLFNLARVGKMEYSTVLDTVEFLAKDSSYITWVPAFRGFDVLLDQVGRDSTEGQELSNRILRLMDAVYESAALSELKPDDQVYTLKQILVMSWACNFGRQDCVDFAREQFAAYKEDGVKLNPNFKYSIICAALKYSDDSSDLQFAWSLYANATLLEQFYLNDAIACAPDPEEMTLSSIYQPIAYEVHLDLPDSVFTETGTEYTGKVFINFTVTEDTNEVQLHSSHEDLRLDAIRIFSVSVEDYSVDEVTDILTVSYPDGLGVGEHELIIDFTGQLRSAEQMDGFYKSSYVDDSGTRRYLVTTQFETTHARRAFPCFDEPALKANFEFYITYPLGLNAIFNTAGTIYSSSSIVGWAVSISHTNFSTSETMHFIVTPKMSTYLLAFMVSDFTCTDPETVNGVVHRVCSKDSTADIRGWAAEMGPSMLEALGNLTGYSFSKVMSKMDQAAIPDFSAGAMENWGLVMYREGDLLWNIEDDSNSERQNVATVIAHEFAHQWFGDLVTLNWWSEVFLNEGFATYCEFHIAHEVLPDFQLVEQFVVDVMQPVLLTDSFEDTKPMQYEVLTTQDINENFGAISYSKGASVLRMVDHLMGNANFRAGLNNYVTLYQLGNSIPENLWSALNEAIDSSVSKLPANLPTVMENWTVNPGMPLLQVTMKDTKVIVTQERFLVNAYDNSSQWYVPVTFTTSLDENKFSQTAPMAWLSPGNELTINIQYGAAWIILNNQLTGYYRVNYDDSLWTAIGDALQQDDFDGIGELNRAQIVDDLFNLVRADRINYSRALDLLAFLQHDTSFITWVPAFNGFSFLLDRVGWYSEEGSLILNQLESLMNTFYESAPVTQPNPDDQVYTLKQVLALTWACNNFEKDDCVEYSTEQFALLNPNFKYIVICAALRVSTDPGDLEFIRGVYETADAKVQYYLSFAMACSPYVEEETYLNDTIRPDPKVRHRQGIKSVLEPLYKNNHKGVDVAFRFLLDNHHVLSELYHTKDAADILPSLADKFTRREQVNQLKEVTQNKKLPREFLASADLAIEIAEANIQWTEKFRDDIRRYYGLNTV